MSDKKETAHDVWKELFDCVWDGTEGTPEDINQIMNLVNKYAELSVQAILEITNKQKGR